MYVFVTFVVRIPSYVNQAKKLLDPVFYSFLQQKMWERDEKSLKKVIHIRLPIWMIFFSGCLMLKILEVKFEKKLSKLSLKMIKLRKNGPFTRKTFYTA